MTPSATKHIAMDNPAIAAEEYMIGAAFLAYDEIDDMLAFLKPHHFFRNLHREIWRAFGAVRGRGVNTNEVSAILIAEELKQAYPGAEVPAYLGTDRSTWASTLALFYTDMPSSYGWQNHAALVKNYWRRREGATQAAELASKLNNGTDPDVVAILAKAARDLVAITDDGGLRDPRPITDFITEARESSENHGIGGIMSPWESLNRITTGWKPGQLVVIAAPTGGGKSAFAAAIALHNIETGVLLFSMEMTGREVAERMICMKADLDSRKYAQGKLDSTETVIARRCEAQIRGNLWIDDTGGIDVAGLRAKALRWTARHGIGLVVVDYLGLVDERLAGAKRNDVVGAISRGLKLLAMEARVPVIALHQLNRDHAKERRAPRLHDLRDSGSVEQDANQVILIHREEEGEIEKHTVHVAKNRGGPCSKTTLMFKRASTRFLEQEIRHGF